jgi:hypothetical protein
MRSSDFTEIFWSVAPWTLFAILVTILIYCAPSIDAMVFGR